MTRGFRRARHDVRARLGDDERRVLRDVFIEVYDLLEDPAASEPAEQDPLAALVGIGSTVRPPEDPALARLLPDAHRDDPEASAEFRRYTESELRARKRSGLRVALDTLARPSPLRLDDTEAQAWLVALTDVRLVLAERMGLRTDDDHALLEQVAAKLAEAQDGSADDPVFDSADESAHGAAADAGRRLAMTLALYDFLAWLQETLVEAMAAALPDERGR